MSDATDLVGQYYAAFNNRDWDAYERLFSADAETVAPGGGEAKGIDAVRGWDQAWIATFPDARLSSLHKAEGRNLIISENRFSGTHTAPLQTPEGELPPTGKYVDAPYVTVFDIEAGKLKVQRIYYNQLELQVQLGLV